MTNNSLLSGDVYVWVRFLIYVGGGALWFFGIGAGVRWILRWLFKPRDKLMEPNHAAGATSKPVPGAASASPQG